MAAGPISPSRGLDRLAWVAVTLPATLLVGYLVLISPQLAGTVAVVVLVSGLYVRSPAAGMAALWTAWFVLPGVRRLFGYADGYVSQDPLAVAPFLATAVVAVLELSKAQLSRRARRLLFLAAVGFLVGFPLGLRASPPGAAFALFAYTAALSAFVLGYAERGKLTNVSLYRVLLIGVPPLALYAIVQYLSLPVWDAAWIEDVGFVTAIAPDGNRPRVFSTLNSPGTFAPLLGLAIVAFLATKRLGAAHLFALLTASIALALTFVRSAWVGLAAAMIALAFASHGRAFARVGVVVAVLALAVPVLGASGTGGQVVSRADTLGSLETDTSAQARITTQTRLVPQLVTEPLGAGLGLAGEATRLGGGGSASGLRAPDSAYLSMLIQLGPFGALLVLYAFFAGVASAMRNAARNRSWTDAALAAMLVYLVVHMVATDLLYGVTGVVLWFLVGLSVRREEDREAQAV